MQFIFILNALVVVAIVMKDIWPGEELGKRLFTYCMAAIVGCMLVYLLLAGAEFGFW
ncbi:hypothetical protein [Atlantibacter subterraneus]|uniref:hypothetical protein n=1 Tax=Atlantibacter subterraneus TaxID=255519 RepID=UPI00289BEA59|nr:hypothetical protein [Atlantibacter subterranea]